MEQEKGLRYLALGDSYTIGEGVEANERWPSVLTAMLRESGLVIADPQIVARTGWTTDELSTGIDAAAPQGTFDLVTLLIGVNNQYRGRDADDYRGEFAGLLARAIAFAGGDPGRVVVLSIPDWSMTPFAEGRDRGGIADAIDRYNEVNRDAAADAGAHWVDVTAQSRDAGAGAGWLVSDGLHPSGRAYHLWAELALPATLAALGRAH